MAGRVRDDIYVLQAQIAKAIGHATRLRIVDTIATDEVSFGDLLRRIGVTKANLSQHLALMRGQGILLSRKDGKQVFYRVANPKLLEACDLLREILIEQIRAESALLDHGPWQLTGGARTAVREASLERGDS